MTIAVGCIYTFSSQSFWNQKQRSFIDLNNRKNRIQICICETSHIDDLVNNITPFYQAVSQVQGPVGCSIRRRNCWWSLVSLMKSYLFLRTYTVLFLWNRRNQITGDRFFAHRPKLVSANTLPKSTLISFFWGPH